jgi:hypothetical protein
LPAGAHGALTVNSGGRLVLAGGDHFFSSLIVNASVTALAAPNTRIFVAGAFALRSPFLLDAPSSQLASIFLGLATSGSVAIESVFQGSLVAPSALVSLGSGSGSTYRGLFYARGLEVRPDSFVECAMMPVPQ